MTESRRLVLLTIAADNRRPVEITYECGKDSPAVETRLIEIHDILPPTKDGNFTVRAFCHLRGEMRTFRIDRIVRHRARRLVWRGPQPKVNPRFSVFGRVPESQRVEPVGKSHSADDFLAAVRERVYVRPLTADAMAVTA